MSADIPVELLPLLEAGREELRRRREIDPALAARHASLERAQTMSHWTELVSAARDVTGTVLDRYRPRTPPADFTPAATRWEVTWTVPGLANFSATFVLAEHWTGEPQWRLEEGEGKFAVSAWQLVNKEVVPAVPVPARTLAEAVALARESWEHREALKLQTEIPF